MGDAYPCADRSAHTSIPVVNLFLKGERGATSIEYALIAMLIFLVIVGAVTLLSEKVIALYNHIAAEIAAAIGGS